MKKIVSLMFVCAMALSAVACGPSKKDNETTQAVTTAKPQETAKPENNNNATDITLSPVESAFIPATQGVYATIKVAASVKMDDETAWLGLCPAGKDYITEAEADEVDAIYYYAETRESDSDPYIFACDFESVEDGTYALVVSTSDDQDVGYVAIQLAMTKAGDKLTFDFENAKIKERPAK